MKLSFVLPLITLLDSSALVNAGVSLSASGNLSASTDPIGNPLNGASFSVKTFFADQTYTVGDRGLPVATGDALQTSITITGATDSTLNGSFPLFADFGTAFYYPSYAGIYGSPTEQNILFFDLGNATYIGLSLFTQATTGGSNAMVGGAMALTDFSNSAILPSGDLDETRFQFIRDSAQSEMTITNGVFAASGIPEPTALTLLVLGSFEILRRKRQVIG